MRRESERTQRISRQLRAAMTPLLATAGFAKEADREWTRQWGWKLDVIDLASVATGIVVNFYVDVPSRTIDGKTEYDILALEGLGHIVGRRLSTFRLPTFRTDEALVREIMSALKTGLPWFDRFATRSGSLECLRRGNRVKDSIGYQECEKYLLGLPAELDRSACLICNRAAR